MSCMSISFGQNIFGCCNALLGNYSKAAVSGLFFKITDLKDFKNFPVLFEPFKCQLHRMVKHIQTIRRQIADELFVCF